MFVEIGIPDEQIVYDRAQEQSEYGGDVGNLIVRIRGRSTDPTLMFSTHLDAVPDCVGCEPCHDAENGRIINHAEAVSSVCH